MTDKEQIIIDGVNVAGCKKHIPTMKMDCILYPLQPKSCSNNPNCYYKQLARKTQECEELKEKLKRISTQSNEVVKQNKDLQTERLKYISQRNIIETELNQLKLLMDGKNTMYEQLKSRNEALEVAKDTLLDILKRHCNSCPCNYDCKNHNLDDMDCVIEDIQNLINNFNIK